MRSNSVNIVLLSKNIVIRCVFVPRATLATASGGQEMAFRIVLSFYIKPLRGHQRVVFASRIAVFVLAACGAKI